jgi:formyltetrahydrofolate synthetase
MFSQSSKPKESVAAQIHRLTEECAEVEEKITAIVEPEVLGVALSFFKQIQTSLNELQAHHVNEMMCMPSPSVDLIRVC